MRFHGIVNPTYVDGPGKRVALSLWPATGGHQASPRSLADILLEAGLPVTISGGEPFDQPVGLHALLEELRGRAPDLHIILYSGYTLEQLICSHSAETLFSLLLIDVLVDGPYVQEQDDPAMQYRGSRNQRVIDMPATVRMPLCDLGSSGPILLDWDTPELILTSGGDLLGATPIARQFAPAGQLTPTRRCGEPNPPE